MSHDPPDPNRKPDEDPGLLDETLSRLEQRLDRASEMAERLIVEAAARAAEARPAGNPPAAGEPPAAGDPPGTGDPPGAGDPPAAGDPPPAGDPGWAANPKPPPAGWQQPSAEPGPSARADARARGEFDLLLEVLGTLRDRIPPELQRRLGEALREVLLALRALIDWYLERTDRRRADPADVEDIPII